MAAGGRTGRNGPNLQQWLGLAIGNRCLTLRGVKPWNGRPREVVGSPSLEIFNTRLDKPLSGTVSVLPQRRGLDLMTSRGPFQL